MVDNSIYIGLIIEVVVNFKVEKEQYLSFI